MGNSPHRSISDPSGSSSQSLIGYDSPSSNSFTIKSAPLSDTHSNKDPGEINDIDELTIQEAKTHLKSLGFSSTMIKQAYLKGATSIEGALDLLTNGKLEEQNFMFSFTNTYCPICNENLNEVNQVIIPSCFDKFCKRCVTYYLQLRIEEGQVLSMPCPRHDCASEIPIEILKSLLPQNLFDKYERFKINEALGRDPNLKWCPKPDCQGYDIGNMNKSNLTCNVCGYQYCYYCFEPWHGMRKCKSKTDYELDKWSKKKGVKFCPNCKRRIEKREGCDHMTCPKCRYEWCWVCGMKYNAGHFDSCEVKIIRKKNPPLWVVLGLYFAPICFIFCVIILEIIAIEKLIEDADNRSSRLKKVLKIRILSYPIAIILGIIFTPLAFALAPFVIGIVVMIEIMRNSKICSSSMAVVWGWVLGIILSPIVVISIFLGIIIGHIVGLVFIIFKAYIAVNRLKDPTYMKPKANYGNIR